MNMMNVESLVEFSTDKYVRVPLENTRGLVRFLCFEPDQDVPCHRHPEADKAFFILKGSGTFTKGSEIIQLAAGNIVKAEAGVFHMWKNGSERLTLLSVLIPSLSYDVAEEAAKMEVP
jgi:quercetin dioxygenase-like cupin family protein